jgi:23S rRNA (uracil1939-C5)-methyltransferase
VYGVVSAAQPTGLKGWYGIMPLYLLYIEGRYMPSPLYSTEVTRLAHDGRGIAKIDGKTVFITGALPKEEVTFRYTQRKSQFDQGQVEEIIKASDERIKPHCIHADICGGCRLQHLSSDAQIFYKQEILLDQLEHFGKVSAPTHLLPPLTASPWGYRRKARLSLRYVNKKERLLIGFHEKQGRYIADLSRCEVLHPAVGHRLVELANMLSQLSIYRAIPQIEVAVGDNAVVLVLRHLEPLTELDRALLLAFGNEYEITWYLQSGNASTVVPLA